MEKEKSVIEKFIHLINKKYKAIEKSFDEASNFSDSLSLIDRVFVSEDLENLEFLANVSKEDFNSLVSLLMKEDEKELATGMIAAHFLLSNGIELVQEQEDKIKELGYRADLKKRSLTKAIERRERALESLEQYSELEQKLQKISVNGVLGKEMIEEVFAILNIKEEDEGNYLNEILRFNHKRFLELSNRENTRTEEVETLELDDDILDIEKSNITRDELRGLFASHGYDLSTFNDSLVERLLQNGDISQMDKIFTSIEHNHLGFVKSNKNHALLVDFLLESSSDLIDGMCAIFESAHVSGEYLKCYKSVFFTSPLEEGYQLKNGKKRKTVSPSSEPTKKDEPSQKPVGRSKHFLENLRILEGLGYDRKFLLENHVKLLTDLPSRLLRSIRELKLYEFPIGSEGFPLSTLSAPKIMEITDRFIELGEEKYILKYSSRLTAYVDGTTERIYALKKKGLPYCVDMGGEKMLLRYVTDKRVPCGLTEEQISDIIPGDCDAILSGNRYSDLLNEYLPSTISEDTLKDPIIQNIEQQYKNSTWSYNINGVLISRKKLLRNYEFLMKQDLIPDDEKDTEQILFVSAINNSKLNMEEVEKVHNGLMGCMALGGNDGILKK